MFTYQLKNDELIINGAMKEGEKLGGICCVGFDWEVIDVFPDNNPGYISVWGRCANPDCPVEADNHWHGVSSFLQEDIAEMLLETEGATE